MKTLNVKWEPWVASANSLPEKPGIYCVWATRPYIEDGKSFVRHADARLLYIGESGGIASRVRGHEKLPSWLSRLVAGESIVYTYAVFDNPSLHESWRKATENCMIATYKPPCNTDDLAYRYDQSLVLNHSGATFGKFLLTEKCSGTNDPADR